MNQAKQWTELRFVLQKDNGVSLELGGDKYPIVKDNKLFDSLSTFESAEEPKVIPIEVYISNMLDVKEFRDFFEATKYNQKYKYKLALYANGAKYNATVTTDDKPYEVNEIEDLYGTVTQPTSSISLELIMEEPYFYSDFSYDTEIGAGTYPKIKYPLSFRLGDNKKFTVSETTPVLPHVIENIGSEDNGFVIIIHSSKKLVNPRIINETTNFVMGFTLEAGINDIITINTIEKTVHLNGILMPNAKRIFDKWMTLPQGRNVIRFEADSGAELSRVQMRFYSKYRAI